MRDLAGKVAVVTGAASGFGRAFSERFAREGMKVVLADIEAGALDRAVGELRAQGFDVTGVVTDVSSRDSVKALAVKTVATYGVPQLVCNNAGIEGYIDGPAWEATPNDWAWTMGVNFWGVVHGVEAFLPLMLENGQPGQIVNTASVAGFTSPNILYSVTKHAVVAYTELIYNHLRELGAPVKIAILAPGASATNIAKGSRNRPASLTNPPDAKRDRVGTRARDTMHAINSAGPPPSEIADRLVEGIKAEQFYIFVDHLGDEWIKARNDSVEQWQDPPKPGRGLILVLKDPGE